MYTLHLTDSLIHAFVQIIIYQVPTIPDIDLRVRDKSMNKATATSASTRLKFVKAEASNKVNTFG